MKKIISIILIINLFIISKIIAQNNDTYQYDNLNRLSKVTFSNGTIYDYSYDQLGNRTTKVITSAAPVLSDLLVQNQSLSQTTFVAGTTVSASCQVANTGAGNAGGNYMKCYLSQNQAYEQGTDIEIGSAYSTSVAALGSTQLNNSITIPSGTAVGSWYVLFFADATTQVSETNENNNIASIPITIVTCSNMQAIINSTNATCGLSNGAAAVNVSGGNQPYAYVWNNGHNTASISNLSGGTYNVTVTDFYGCSHTSNVTVNSITPPSLTTTSSPSTCGNNNGSTTATITGGTTPYTYLWNNGHTTNIINNLSAGNYAVTVTDASSCTVNGNVIVSSPGNLNASLNPTNPSCGGSNGALTATVTGGTQPFIFNWSNGMQTQTITGLQVGSYSLTITDANNCTFSTNMSLSSVNNMSASFTTQNTTCGNANGTATATGSNGATPYSYHWSNGQNTQTATNLASGAYNITITDANNCSIISYATVGSNMSPTLNLTSTTTSCSSNTGTATVNVTNGTPIFTYLWSNGQALQTATGLGSGLYTVTVTDGNGCIVSSSITVVFQNSQPVIPTNGLVAYYPFNGNANDMSGNNNNGTVNGATLTSDRLGNANSAYNFAGISNPQTIMINNSSTLQFTNAATFSFWINMNSYQGMDTYGNNNAYGAHAIFAKDFDQCCLYAIIYGQPNGQFSVGLGTGYGGIGTSDTVPNSSINQWINLIFTISNSNVSIYANGNLIASQNGTMSFSNPNSKNLWFGRLGASTWYPFNGKMDNIRIYNRVLNNTEISQLYQAESASPIAVNLGNDTTVCSNQSITLNAGGGFNTYQWSTNETTQSINLSNLNTGTHQYIVTVTACGASAKDTINVLVNTIPSAPSVGINTQPTCAVSTGSVILNGLPSTGTWTLTRAPGGTTITGTGTSTTITGLAAGTYTYTVSNASGCSSAASANIVVNAQPETPSVPIINTITQPTCALATGSVVLNGLPALANWIINPGGIAGTGASSTITGLTQGTYSYTITNSSSGCTSLVSANVVVNSQPTTPTAPAIGATTQPTCTDSTGSVVLNGLPSGNWVINPGNITGSATSATISNLTEGTYNFTVTNASGCTSLASANMVINAQPIPPTPTISLNLNILHSDVANGNQWYNQNGLINNATNQDYTVTSDGDYYVIVTLLGCSSDTSNIINVLLSGELQVDKNQTIKVYPNPVTNELIIEYDGNKETVNFEIYNSIMQVVFNGSLLEKTVVQTSKFAPGVYLIKLGNGKTFEFKKIVKE